MEMHITHIAGKKIVVNASQGLKPQARWLLVVIEKSHRNGFVIKDGSRLQIGWSFLTFRRQADESFIVCEPNYFKNPFQDELRSVDLTLEVQARQVDFVTKYGIDPQITSFQDKIIFAEGALSVAQIYMERSSPNAEKHDSGWYIRPRAKSEVQPKLEAIYAFQLLTFRPELFDILILPTGFAAFVNENGVEEILDAQNNSILK